MKSEHLPLLNSVSAPALHPDGTRAVVSVLRPDFDADAYVGQLWTVPLDPDRPARRLTRGFRDAAPDFSPDGQVLAFLRAAAGGKPQLHIVEADGGEPQPVTDAPLGVSSFAWSPDSRHIVYSARTPEEGRYGRTDGVSAGGEDARLITDYQYRMNGVGYTADKPLQLFLSFALLCDISCSPCKCFGLSGCILEHMSLRMNNTHLSGDAIDNGMLIFVHAGSVGCDGSGYGGSN